jgi:hypothetical protein
MDLMVIYAYHALRSGRDRLDTETPTNGHRGVRIGELWVSSWADVPKIADEYTLHCSKDFVRDIVVYPDTSAPTDCRRMVRIDGVWEKRGFGLEEAYVVVGIPERLYSSVEQATAHARLKAEADENGNPYYVARLVRKASKKTTVEDLS